MDREELINQIMKIIKDYEEIDFEPPLTEEDVKKNLEGLLDKYEKEQKVNKNGD